MYRVEGVSTKVLEFLKENNDISLKQGEVQIQFIEFSGLIHVMLEVGVLTTHDELRDAIPLVLAWRDRLLKHQGPWMAEGMITTQMFWNSLHERGMSHRKIAEAVNDTVANYLMQHVELNKEYKTNQYLNMAKDILVGLEKDENIQSILDIGLENIRQGKPPFEKDYPVSRDKIIGVLRNWDKSKIKRAIVLKGVEKT